MVIKVGDLVEVIHNATEWNINGDELPQDTHLLPAIAYKDVNKVAIVLETYLAFDHGISAKVNVYKIFMQETCNYVMALENEIILCNNTPNQDITNA
jgi:hypothetical protein